MKRICASILILALLLQGCSKPKEEVKTDEVKEETKKEETKKEEAKKEEVKEVSESEKALLKNRAQFLNSTYIYSRREPGVVVDFSQPDTLQLQFEFILDTGFAENVIDETNGEVVMPYDFVYNTGIKLFNKEYNKDSGGKFAETYDPNSNAYKLVIGGKGGAGIPYFDSENLTYSIEQNGTYIVEAPYYEVNPDWTYSQVGITRMRFGKSTTEPTNFYYLSYENILK